MATYECNQCGMSVNARCGKCDIPLQNGMLDLDDGTQVQISESRFQLYSAPSK